MSRVSSRIRVDLPEPDRPITTNTSPGDTSNETSLTAITQPVLACRSLRDRSASGVPTILSAPFPKIFHKLSTASAASCPDDVIDVLHGGRAGLALILSVWRSTSSV